MTGHEAFERLAATAMDFRLAPADRLTLDRHLDTCADCRHYAATLGGDADLLRNIAVVPAPARVRTVVLRAAGRPAPRRPVWHLIAAAILLLALLGVAAIGVGALLQRDAQPLGPISWTTSAPPATGAVTSAASDLHHVAFGDGAYVIGGAIGGTAVLWTGGGDAWSKAGWQVGRTEIAEIQWIEDGPFGSGFVVAGGENEAAAAVRPTIWWRASGGTWRRELVERAPGLVRAVVAWQGRILAFGSISRTEEPEPGVVDVVVVGRIWERSSDGTWTVVESGPELSWDLVAVAPTGSSIEMLASSGGQLVTLTRDGRVATAEGPEAGAFALLWADGTLLAVGNTADAPTVRIRVGETWSEGGPLPSGAGAIAAGIVHRNGQFVIVGSGPSGALAWSSPDGRTWTIEAALPEAGGALIRDATGDATGLLAIGARGTLPVLWHASIESKELP